MTARIPGGRRVVEGLSIDVWAGEIVGVAGVEGNGQGAIGDLLAGLLQLESGEISVAGRPVRCRAAALLAAGVGVVPEDPRTSGLALSMSVEDNLAATHLAEFRRGPLLDRRAVRQHARALMDAYGIVASSPAAPVATLSGGNQQRVVVARELSQSPVVLVAVQPTRGLDVGAIEVLMGRFLDAAASGVGVLFVSTELDQLLAVSDRIAVLYGGRIVGEMAKDRIDAERLGLLMGGRVA